MKTRSVRIIKGRFKRLVFCLLLSDGRLVQEQAWVGDSSRRYLEIIKRAARRWTLYNPAQGTAREGPRPGKRFQLKA